MIPDNKNTFKIGKTEYLYVNEKERIKPCCRCLKVLSFENFRVQKDKISGHLCLDCTSKENLKNWKGLNPEQKKKRIDAVAEYKKKNRDKIKAYWAIPINRIRRNITTRIRKKVTEIIWEIKNGKRIDGKRVTPDIEIGMDTNQLKCYLESLFLPEMSWDNYGPGYIIEKDGSVTKLKQWSVDHIVPVSRWNLEDLEEIKKINHYTNLRPMWCSDNSSKNAKLDEEIEDLEFKLKYVRTERDIEMRIHRPSILDSSLKYLNPTPCSRCREVKLVKDFNLSNGKCSRYCKLCANAVSKEAYLKKKERQFLTVGQQDIPCKEIISNVI